MYNVNWNYTSVMLKHMLNGISHNMWKDLKLYGKQQFNLSQVKSEQTAVTRTTGQWLRCSSLQFCSVQSVVSTMWMRFKTLLKHDMLARVPTWIARSCIVGVIGRIWLNDPTTADPKYNCKKTEVYQLVNGCTVLLHIENSKNDR